METAIVVLWAVGLALALALTLIVLKLVALVLRTLSDLRTLARRTADAAEGLADALAGAARLGAALEPALRLRTGAESLASAATRVSHAADGGPAGPGRP